MDFWTFVFSWVYILCINHLKFVILYLIFNVQLLGKFEKFNPILSYPLLHQRRINIFQQNYKIFGEFFLYHTDTITKICLISLSMDFIYCPPIRNHVEVHQKTPQ